MQVFVSASIRIPPEMLEQSKNRAHDEHLSYNAYILSLIRKDLADHGQPAGRG